MTRLKERLSIGGCKSLIRLLRQLLFAASILFIIHGTDPNSTNMSGGINNDEHVLVAMSGGVDSSVAALLLHDQGRKVSGMFMKNWEEDDRFGACTAEEDAADAMAVAEKIGIRLHRRNFAAEYWDFVFENFLHEYRVGRTPNPDILCNREIKFKTFLEHAHDLGASRIATGHYVRSDEVDGRFRLLRGRDHNKDQSYFVYTLGQDQLANAEFPVGELEKPAVRKRAQQAGLITHNKKDSTGICFIGERNFRDFLSQYLAHQPGPILAVSDDGTVGKSEIGEHPGLMFFTLGQRQGLGIGGVRGYDDAPWYVLHKDQDTNTLYVAQNHSHPWLLSDRLEASQLSWVSGEPPLAGSRVQAQVRYRQSPQECSVECSDNGSLKLVFETPQRAVTPGQSVVLYQHEVCLGGGIIESSNAQIEGTAAHGTSEASQPLVSLGADQ